MLCAVTGEVVRWACPSLRLLAASHGARGGGGRARGLARVLVLLAVALLSAPRFSGPRPAQRAAARCGPAARVGRVVAGDRLRAAVGSGQRQRDHRDRPGPDRRDPPVRGRGRSERDRARQLRLRAAQPVRHPQRVLRRRHRQRDPRPPRRHLRLARPRQPTGLGHTHRHRHPGPQRWCRQPARRCPPTDAYARELGQRVRGRHARPERWRDGEDRVGRQRARPRRRTRGGEARDRRRQPDRHLPLPHPRRPLRAAIAALAGV